VRQGGQRTHKNENRAAIAAPIVSENTGRMNGTRPASLARLAIFSNDMEEAMTSAHELAQQRRTVFRRETERITRRIIRALNSAKLTSEDGLRDYGRLYWMIGKQLAVHCRRKSEQITQVDCARYNRGVGRNGYRRNHPDGGQISLAAGSACRAALYPMWPRPSGPESL